MLVSFPSSSNNSTQRRQTRVRVAVLGSTGSIGGSTLDIIRAHPEQFEVVALAAGGSVNALANQIKEFSPLAAAIADTGKLGELRTLCPGCKTELGGGADAVEALAALPEADVVVAAVVGVAGLRPVARAVNAGKRIALANKESIVVGGRLLAEAQAGSGAVLLPVDSEHSAIFQALQGASPRDVQSLLLTASGGPFRSTPLDAFKQIRPEQALRHPNWTMGAKITIDSATMVNKALELIEAHWLFGIPEDRIAVLVHPQSIMHSAVSFVDGSMIAQLSVPDMKGPIAYALSYPYGRMSRVMPPLDLALVQSLQFEPVDAERFPAVNLARHCLRAGGAMPAVFNAANEAAVQAFMNSRIRFDQISQMIQSALDHFSSLPAGETIEALLSLDQQVREWGMSRFCGGAA